MEKNTLILGILIGIILGSVATVLIEVHGLSVIFGSIHTDSISVSTNISIPLNETKLAEGIANNLNR